MDEHTMMAAITYKNLECMIYLLQNGIGELTADVVVACVSAGSVDCLRYAIENGAPYIVFKSCSLCTSNKKNNFPRGRLWEACKKCHFATFVRLGQDGHVLPCLAFKDSILKKS